MANVPTWTIPPVGEFGAVRRVRNHFPKAEKKTAVSGGRVQSPLDISLLQAVRCFARSVLDVACRLMQVTLCLVGFSFVFQFLIAAELASSLFYGSFGFVRGAFNVFALLLN